MRRPAAFTILELLVVVAIIAVLVAILMPALLSVRRKAMRIKCMSNLKQTGMATQMYLDDSRGKFWRYYRTVPNGRMWWFGYEPGGPGSGQGRPLDKSRGVLARYLQSVDDDLQCPSFDYDDPLLFHKFDHRAASYGFNIRLGPATPFLPTQSRSGYVRDASRVFIFADAIHFDFGDGYNEGHYISYTPGAAAPSGYGHFRHEGGAMTLMMDLHVEGQSLHGEMYKEMGGGPAGNLAADDGSDAIYGYLP